MSDEAAADEKEPLTDDGEEDNETWLRRVAQGPDTAGLAQLPRRGKIIGGKYRIEQFLCEAPDASPREAKVLDFGVSSIAAIEGADSTLTKAGTLLGSPAYMSPEQLKDPHDVDARTDVYAFGIILYEAFAGFRPFQADNPGALIIAIESVAPKPPSHTRTDLPPGLEQVVLRAFARDPAARHPSMNSLIETLQAFGSAGR